MMKKKKKGKRIETGNGETLILPEAIIQHIQSFLSGKEAARSAILSKLWYAAWLTRPTVDLDEEDFRIRNSFLKRRDVFEEFAKKTIQRYQDLSLKIESFDLRMNPGHRWAHNLIVNAVKMGATHLKLTLLSSNLILPQEVLGSQTLVELFIYGLKFKGSYVINCLTLKSLTLNSVRISGDVFKDLISRCISIEDLSLSNFYFESRTNMYELHKLRRLFLQFVDVNNMFFTDFASRFPCLKDLTIHYCSGCNKIHIASTSLQTISFKPILTRRFDMAKFDVPNIRKFIYSASGLPSHLSINGASSREWEFDISILCSSFPRTSWLMDLKKLLNNFTLSRISLFMNVQVSRHQITECDHEVDVEVVPNPLVLENLIIHAPPTFCCKFLVRSFGVFRPKFITHPDWTKYPFSMQDEVKSVCKRVIQALTVSNWQETFGQFGLKKVNLEICKEFDTVWQPLQLKKHVGDLKPKVRFQLLWED